MNAVQEQEVGPAAIDRAHLFLDTLAQRQERAVADIPEAFLRKFFPACRLSSLKVSACPKLCARPAKINQSPKLYKKFKFKSFNSTVNSR